MEMAISNPHIHQHLHQNHHHQSQSQQSQQQMEYHHRNFNFNFNSKSKIKKKIPLSLENYIEFLHSRDLRFLNVEQLNEIISIHGFKKVQKQGRKVSEQAVEAIEPINPIRSTLNENISSKSFINLNEAIKDLVSLNWQECSITSIKTINSVNYYSTNSALIPSNTLPNITTALPAVPKGKRSSVSRSSSSSRSKSPATSLEIGSSGPRKSGAGSNTPGSEKKKKKRSKPITPVAMMALGCGEKGSGESSSHGMVPGVSKKRKSMKRVYLGETA